MNKKNDQQSRLNGHLCALLTILIWGTTFISTKILLNDFQPVEILFLRFVIGWLVLLPFSWGHIKGSSMKQEMLFAAAGLCGICLYYLLENIALTFTLASNVGVIISTAPFFTAILSWLFVKDEKLSLRFGLGFLASMAGIALISFSGSQLQLNPFGDFLALAAAFVWACYSVLMKKISRFAYPTIAVTWRIFSYGILFMLPAVFLSGIEWNFAKLVQTDNLFNILYLGIGASALCFVTWNKAVQILGALKTSVYIYLVPVITMVSSTLILQEPITLLSAAGMVLTLAGLLLSESRGNRQKGNENHGCKKREMRAGSR